MLGGSALGVTLKRQVIKPFGHKAMLVYMNFTLAAGEPAEQPRQDPGRWRGR